MSDILGVGGIIGGLISGVKTFIDVLKDIGTKLLDIGKDLLKWVFGLVVEKPEIGVTLLAIILYMFSPITL